MQHSEVLPHAGHEAYVGVVPWLYLDIVPQLQEVNEIVDILQGLRWASAAVSTCCKRACVSMACKRAHLWAELLFERAVHPIAEEFDYVVPFYVLPCTVLEPPAVTVEVGSPQQLLACLLGRIRQAGLTHTGMVAGE